MSVNKRRKKKRRKTSTKRHGVSPARGPIKLNIVWPKLSATLALPRIQRTDSHTEPQSLSLEAELERALRWFKNFYYSRPYLRQVTNRELLKRARNYRELAATLPDVDQRDVVVKGMREAADHLHSLLVREGGRPSTDFDEAWCVSLMVDAYKRHGHKKPFEHVAAKMLEAVPELKKPKDERAWAKDRYQFWKRLQKDRSRLKRVLRERERLEILTPRIRVMH